VERAKENVRALRLSMRGGKSLHYEHENGFPFVVLPDVPETRFIYLAGQSYERTESALMRSWLSAGDVASDCGGNVGLMSGLMATGVGGAGRVVSMEASPDTCRRLES